MSCFKPLRAYLGPGGLQFSEKGSNGVPLDVPCRQCTGCRIDRAREWTLRCMHEATLHGASSFVTLTYAPQSLPPDGSLCYRHVQLFLKRLRKELGIKIRFYLAGEYGENGDRPHYHILFFGWRPTDLVKYRYTVTDSLVETSPLLTRVWGLGFVGVGEFNLQSVGYVARYVMKKLIGKTHYESVCPETGVVTRRLAEFNRCSTNPGIGAAWYDKWHRDAFPGDFLVHNGTKYPVPKFYARRLKERNPDMYDQVLSSRTVRASRFAGEKMPDRLRAREEVAAAGIRHLKRGFS